MKKEMYSRPIITSGRGALLALVTLLLNYDHHGESYRISKFEACVISFSVELSHKICLTIHFLWSVFLIILFPFTEILSITDGYF